MPASRNRTDKPGAPEQRTPDCRDHHFLSLISIARYWAQELGTNSNDQLRKLCFAAHVWLTSKRDFRDAYRKSGDSKFLVVSAANERKVVSVLSDIAFLGAKLNAPRKRVLSAVDVFREDFEDWCSRNSARLPLFWLPGDSGHDIQANRGQCKKPSATTEPDDPLEVFRAMEDLAPGEVSFRFVPSDQIEVAARDTKRRVHYAALGLWDRRRGSLNKMGVILVGLTKSGPLPRNVKGNDKAVSRIRTELFRDLLGVSHNPFGQDWMPHFKIEDRRNARDERAQTRARHVHLDEEKIYRSSEEYPYDKPDDDDIAKAYLT